MKNLSLIGILFFLLTSCNVSPSYTVRIKNSTGEDLSIAYKTLNEYSKGEVEETIILKDGAAETILMTKDFIIPEGSEADALKPCEFVAEYMTFKIRDNVESNLKWCDPSIKLETMDIGQEEFSIDFKLTDFSVE